MIWIFVVTGALFVAFANGANDNFKGAATLFGCGTTDYRRALIWATATTFLGSLAAILLAGHLITSFGGKGLVDDAVALQPQFAAAVALGAAATVFSATRVGMPISTTHSLMGALVGTGIAAGSAINLDALWSKFLLPLLVSPVIAIVATAVIYPLLSLIRRRMGLESEYCICVGSKVHEIVPATDLNCHAAAIEKAESLSLATGDMATCVSRYKGKFVGIEFSELVDRGHFLSAGIVSFARGLNDTPKIAALILLTPSLSPLLGLSSVGIMIAIGALLCAKRVAETMSNRITAMNHGQGFTCNVITGLIVIFFSRFGLPVSTTHVSCGSLFGLGFVNGGAKKSMIVTILAAWVTTLPFAGCISAVTYWLLSKNFG